MPGGGARQLDNVKSPKPVRSAVAVEMIHAATLEFTIITSVNSGADIWLMSHEMTAKLIWAVIM